MWANIILGTIILALIPFLFAAYGGHVATEGLPKEKKYKVKLVFWVLFFAGLILAFVQQYRSETAQGTAQRRADEVQRRNEAFQNRVQNDVQSLVQQGQMVSLSKMSQSQEKRITEKVPDHKKQASSLPAINPIAAEIERRRQILNALRDEYILSHDNISAAMIAGTEYPPTEWMNKRLSQLEEQWRFNETKDEMILRADKISNELDNCGNELADAESVELGYKYPQYHECAKINISAIILKRDMLRLLASSCQINIERESIEEQIAASTFLDKVPPHAIDAIELGHFNEGLVHDLRYVAGKLQAGKCP